MRCASGSTVGIHSFRGRPTLRTNLDVAGCRVPGANEALRIGSPSGLLSIFPKRISWRFANFADVLWNSADSNTVALETRETYAGGIFKIVRKHLAWKPSNLRNSAFVKHPVESAYKCFVSTRSLNISNLRRRDSAE